MKLDCNTIESLLADAAAGRLGEKEQQHVQSHLPSCESCQTSMRRLSLLRSDLKNPTPSAPAWFTSNVLYAVRRQKEGRYHEKSPIAAWSAVACTTLLAMVYFCDKQFPARLAAKVGWVTIETQNAQSQKFPTVKKSGFEIAGPAASLKIARQIIPDYTESARRQKLTGVIEIYFMTDTEGSVEPNVRVVKATGHKTLDQSAIRALQQWKFVPSAPSKTAWGVITFQFPPSF